MAEQTAPKKRGRPRKNPEPTMELATMEETKPVKQTRNRPDLANSGRKMWSRETMQSFCSMP